VPGCKAVGDSAAGGASGEAHEPYSARRVW
jgi:hypothetical protein